MKLTVENLSFSYRRKPVLHDVSFSLEQGQVLCVLGPNGVGKSTLFRCLLGLLKNYTGSVLLDDRQASGLTQRELARRIAYIPQFSAPVFQYSVFHTVLMGTTSQIGTFSTPGKAQEALAMQALETMGIAGLKDRPVGMLSGGERQMVLIARALAQNSPLLVMDEPTASLDFGNSIRVMEMVRRLADKGYGIVLSTHNPDLALRYGTHALVLDEGRVCSFGRPEQAVTPQLLSRIYGVEVEILPVEGCSQHVCIPASGIK